MARLLISGSNRVSITPNTNHSYSGFYLWSVRIRRSRKVSIGEVAAVVLGIHEDSNNSKDYRVSWCLLTAFVITTGSEKSVVNPCCSVKANIPPWQLLRTFFISCGCCVHYVRNQDLDVILREADLQKKQNAHTWQVFCAKVRNHKSGLILKISKPGFS